MRPAPACSPPPAPRSSSPTCRTTRATHWPSEIGGAFAHVDVTDTAHIMAAVDRPAELGPLRVLVNSAGIGPAARTVGRDGTYQSAHDLDLDQSVISINLIGTFDAIRIAGTAMSRLEPLESGERGAIVNLASWRPSRRRARRARPRARRAARSRAAHARDARARGLRGCHGAA